MPDTAIDPIPKQGICRRALATVDAWLQALDYTGFDYTLDRTERLERELAQLKRVAPKPGGEFQHGVGQRQFDFPFFGA
jgi:hypothetical protein